MAANRPRRSSTGRPDYDVDQDHTAGPSGEWPTGSSGAERRSSRQRRTSVRYAENAGDVSGGTSGDVSVVRRSARRAMERGEASVKQEEKEAVVARDEELARKSSSELNGTRSGGLSVRLRLKDPGGGYVHAGDARDVGILGQEEPEELEPVGEDEIESVGVVALAPVSGRNTRGRNTRARKAISEPGVSDDDSDYSGKEEDEEEEEEDGMDVDVVEDLEDGEVVNDDDFFPDSPSSLRRSHRKRNGGSDRNNNKRKRAPIRRSGLRSNLHGGQTGGDDVQPSRKKRTRSRTQFLIDDKADGAMVQPGARNKHVRDRARDKDWEKRRRSERNKKKKAARYDTDDDQASDSASSDSSDAELEQMTADTLDYDANPMALDGDTRARPGRYTRRRGRSDLAGAGGAASASGARRKDGPAPAGVEPIQVDLNLSWDDVGGLDHHVRALKEMVFLPLLYPEVFDKFKMEPPKGVLFYGPPGTGKTLCARALAASCGSVPPEAESVTAAAAASGANAGASDKAEARAPAEVVGVEASGLPAVNPCAVAVVEPGTIGNGPKDDGELVVTIGVVPLETGQVIVGTEGNGVDTTAEDAAGMLAALSASQGDAEKPSLLEAVDPLPGVDVAGDHAQVPKPTIHGEGPAAALPTGNNDTGFVGHLPTPPADAAASCARPRPRVAFFMRNGADCLSKWVGEAERQLRMTFEAAKKHQPSIIFFDEIDGLAPVRSARQDQIHSSIVSTLLGLMDGLDGRGQVVVIGATNRVDSVDPALRRPGRFDRELIFTLPNGVARRKILDIHTSHWKPEPPQSDVLDAVASKTVGYCGADLRALCSESALRALRRRYPQIYKSSEKLLIDVDQVQVRRRDFVAAMQQIVPASHRSARTHARPIPPRLAAVLESPLDRCIQTIKRIFPQGITPECKAVAAGMNGRDQAAKSHGSAACDDGDDDDNDVDSCWSSDEEEGMVIDISRAGKQRAVHGRGSMDRPVLRPRLLVCGEDGLGQDQIGPALLHYLEGCPVHAIDLPSLFADGSSRSSEESLVTAVREACRSVPSILYLPHIGVWWEAAHDVLRKTLTIVLRDIPAELPLLVLATAGQRKSELPIEVCNLFSNWETLVEPTSGNREALFEPLRREAEDCPKVTDAAMRRRRAKRRAEILPKAPPPPPKPVTALEQKDRETDDDRYIRALRMEMREFVERLRNGRRFEEFRESVDPIAVPDYLDVIKDPVWIDLISVRVDKGEYPTVLAMVKDFDQLVANVIKYNPPHSEEGAKILRKAHRLVDVVHSWVDNLRPELVERCNAIVLTRLQKMRLETPKAAVDAAAAATLPETSLPGSNAAAAASVAQQVVAAGPPPATEDGDVVMETELSSSKPNGSSVAVVLGSDGISGDAGAADSIVKQVDGDGGAEKAEEEAPVEEEPHIPAVSADIMGLEIEWLKTTKGKSIDSIDTLLTLCSSTLYDNRRSRDRSAVVKSLLALLRERR